MLKHPGDDTKEEPLTCGIVKKMEEQQQQQQKKPNSSRLGAQEKVTQSDTK